MTEQDKRMKLYYVYIEQLEGEFTSLGLLKEAVDSAYSEHGDVVFDDPFPSEFCYPSFEVYREMTSEEILEEEALKDYAKNQRRQQFERLGDEYGWKYE